MITNPAVNMIGIENTNTNNEASKAILIGADDTYDFYAEGAWITGVPCLQGQLIPLQATGARHNTDSTAPDAGDIFFLIQ